MPLKYELFAERLREAIVEGQFPLGSLLPSSRDLAKDWGVSRETAVRALELLRADALVEARQGARFTVIATPLARPAGARSNGSSRTDGALPFSIVGVPAMLRPPVGVAERMALAPGEEALRRVRVLHRPDGVVQSVVSAWFPAWIAETSPRLLATEPIPEGTTRYVRACTGASPVESEDDESLRRVDAWEAGVLGVTEGAVAHVLLHAAWDERGRVLVAEEGVTPAGLWRRVTRYPMVGSS